MKIYNSMTGKKEEFPQRQKKRISAYRIPGWSSSDFTDDFDRSDLWFE